MLINALKKAVAYIKEIQDISLFMTMSNSRWYAAFSGSPLFYVMLPFMSILFTVSALINGYQFSKTHNKNFDKLFDLIISATCAVLASSSLLGAIIAASAGTVFVAGPWLFLASAGLALVAQVFMAALNGYRALESIEGSAQRVHYIQAALNHVFTSLLLTAVLGCVVFVMLTPIAPALGSACATAAVLLTASNILWRMIPTNLKTAIKGLLGLSKPEAEEIPAETNELDSSSAAPEPVEIEPSYNYFRLFSRYDYTAKILSCSLEEGEHYLLRLIATKRESFNTLPEPHAEKIVQKAELLAELSLALKYKTEIPQKGWLEKYPMAFQNFWADKGEVERIFDAALIFKQRYDKSSIVVIDNEQTNPANTEIGTHS